MIRTLLTTTALAALLASGAIAQDAPAETTDQPAVEAPADDAAAPADETTAPAAETDAMDTEDAASDDGTTTETEVDVEVTTEPATDAAAPAATDIPNLLAEGYTVADTDNLASTMIGSDVYSSAAGDAEVIGSINDLVVNESGEVAAVVIGVGGFLGIGEKHVAVSFEALEFAIADDNTERFVISTTREALEAAPDFELVDDNPATDAAGAGTTGVAPGAAAPAQEPPQDAGAMATDPAAQPGATQDQMAPGAFDVNNMESFDESTLTAEELRGTDVYNTSNEHIGTIGDFVLGSDQTVDAVIIDFGGFLGIGAKQVAIAYEDLDFVADAAGNRALVLDVTREEMEAAPEFNADTYEAERDSQRFVTQ